MSRILISLGVLFVLLGAIAWGMERAGLRPGQLPGDLVLGSGNTRFYFPIITCILLSVILTLLMWAAGALRR